MVYRLRNGSHIFFPGKDKLIANKHFIANLHFLCVEHPLLLEPLTTKLFILKCNSISQWVNDRNAQNIRNVCSHLNNQICLAHVAWVSNTNVERFSLNTFFDNSEGICFGRYCDFWLIPSRAAYGKRMVTHFVELLFINKNTQRALSIQVTFGSYFSTCIWHVWMVIHTHPA